MEHSKLRFGPQSSRLPPVSFGGAGTGSGGRGSATRDYTQEGLNTAGLSNICLFCSGFQCLRKAPLVQPCGRGGGVRVVAESMVFCGLHSEIGMTICSLLLRGVGQAAHPSKGSTQEAAAT